MFTQKICCANNFRISFIFSCFFNLSPDVNTFFSTRNRETFFAEFNFFFISIFIRWSSMNKRLIESRVFYEEASWFDGQTWEKPFFLIKNDKLLSTQKIQPVIRRIWTTILIHLVSVLILNL